MCAFHRFIQRRSLFVTLRKATHPNTSCRRPQKAIMINKFADIKKLSDNDENMWVLTQRLSDVKINANKLRIIINPFSYIMLPLYYSVSKAQRMMKFNSAATPSWCRRRLPRQNSQTLNGKKERLKNETLINELVDMSWFIPIDEFNGLNQIRKRKKPVSRRRCVYFP